MEWLYTSSYAQDWNTKGINKMLHCADGRDIYVVCPSGVKTGGTELLHQLVKELRNNHLNAKIAYTRHVANPTPKSFEIYVNDYCFVDQIEDRNNVVVVLPETFISYLFLFNSAFIVVWWLSVDNYMKYESIKSAYHTRGIAGIGGYFKNKAWEKVEYPISKINMRIRLNLAQSYYAIDFLKKNNFENIIYLSDYINLDYIHNSRIDMPRKNVVLYNPVKGKEFTKHLISKDPSMRWKPLIGMTNDEVRKCLETSKVYVDFGNHPGKDRFPREAAMCGCCVITGKRGAAGFYKDIPIPSKYKFDDKKKEYDAIIEKIKYCFDNFSDAQADFEEYRETIKNEPLSFKSDVKKIFVD
jgi:hypothetical protein